MRWSLQQDAALQAVAQWRRDPGDKQVFALFGYAGTGKSTIAKHAAEGEDSSNEAILYATYTGKAAHVLRQKGIPAQTIHSLIYVPTEKSRLRLAELEQQLVAKAVEFGDPEDPRLEPIRQQIREERKVLSRPSFTLNPDSILRQASLVVIDECSMVDARMGEDLLSFGVPILVLGDPAQLPPVGGGGFFTEREPDVVLTEIHRQAADSPIIRLATYARNKQPLPLGKHGDSMVINTRPEDPLGYDQILVGKNKTRSASNHRVRTLKGIDSALPVSGDKLVCLRNDHELGLLNGAIWHVAHSVPHSDERIYLSLNSDEGALIDVEAHTAHFLGKAEALPWWERKEAQELDYGYAITVHKSQGSQWKDILLIDESSVFRQDAWRHLYTGITRAAERICVVQR